MFKADYKNSSSMIWKESVTLHTKPSPHDILPPKPPSIMEFSKHEHGIFLVIVQKHIHDVIIKYIKQPQWPSVLFNQSYCKIDQDRPYRSTKEFTFKIEKTGLLNGSPAKSLNNSRINFQLNLLQHSRYPQFSICIKKF